MLILLDKNVQDDAALYGEGDDRDFIHVFWGFYEKLRNIFYFYGFSNAPFVAF